MRSSTGQHYIALDHLRALAAFFVFSWHFVHNFVPVEYAPEFFLFGLLEEGHVGVALFMTLSGYLFAKLLNGKQIDYGAFLWARFLRLAPLLVLVMVIEGVRLYLSGGNLAAYGNSIARGLLRPTWPNGGWSITVEAHFYILLPALLWLAAKSPAWLGVALAAAALSRVGLYLRYGGLQDLAYWTIVGRIDQFLLGLMAFHFSHLVTLRHVRVIGIMLAFALVYWWFDASGGFYGAPDAIWIILPTLEGLSWAAFIAYYDTSFKLRTTGVSKFIGLIGTYSFSIYLLHFFFVPHAARFIYANVMPVTTYHMALAWSIAAFLCMVPIGYLSFRFIESPFLRKRVKYVKSPGEMRSPGEAGAVTAHPG